MSDSLASQSDAELLKQFAKTRDERVFEQLMERYGRLVMTICLRALQNQHDAEDAFQATFLVLAEKAAKIKKRESLPSWLSGVAHRLSMNLARKRHRKDLSLKAEPEAARDHFADLEQRFDAQAMDEELHALPAKYRDALVRFYFLGQTSRQIAEALGITQGSADGRIKRGRQELRIRLARRGVALGALTVMAISAQTASAAVAPTVMQSTLQAVAASNAAGFCSPSALDLAGTELMKTSFLSASATAASVAVVLLGLGTFGLNAAFARAIIPTEPSINTLTDGNVEPPAAVVAMSQKDVAKREQWGSDVYEPKVGELDEWLKSATKLVPDASIRKRSGKLFVSGSKSQLAIVEKLFAKAGVKPVSQTRLNSKPKADQLPPNKLVSATYRVDPPLDTKLVSEGLKGLKLGQAVVADTTARTITVAGTAREHASVREFMKSMAKRTKTAVPPTFVKAKLSADGRSVMVPTATGGTQTYTVQVPYVVTRINDDGERVRETKFRTETRIRTVNPGQPGVKKVYKLEDLQIEAVGISGAPIASLKAGLDGKKLVVVLNKGEALGEAYRQVLRPETIVITLPESGAPNIGNSNIGKW